MSARSRRQHKPTSKFLNFYTTELTSSEEVRKQKSVKNQASHRNSSAITNEKVLKDVQIPDESHKDSPSSICSNSSEVRRSSRQHKPNQKLKEFLQSSLDDRRTSGAGVSSSPPVQKKGRKEARDGSGLKRSTNKSVATISPMIRQEGIQAPIMGSKNISVELVDCFEALARDLAKTHPVTKTENDTFGVGKTAVGNHSNENVAGIYAKKSGETSEVAEEHFATRRATKRSFGEETRTEPPLPKQQRLAPSVVRNLTRTKKSTEVTTVVETVDLDSPPRRTLKTVTQNKRSKVTKQYPMHHPSSGDESLPSSPSTCSSPSVRHTPRQQPQRGAHHHHHYQQQQATTSPSAHHLQKKRSAQERNRQERDIKETLKKFIIMGTKVANAISETLKHNEETLLAKSSAFEKKCLSLVHALAKQGADLEEDDMEKVLKLLDEEQEERRLYRHTFLESLRVSHLTNMALYNHMLQLLRTL